MVNKYFGITKNVNSLGEGTLGPSHSTMNVYKNKKVKQTTGPNVLALVYINDVVYCVNGSPVNTKPDFRVSQRADVLTFLYFHAVNVIPDSHRRRCS